MNELFDVDKYLEAVIPNERQRQVFFEWFATIDATNKCRTLFIVGDVEQGYEVFDTVYREIRANRRGKQLSHLCIATPDVLSFEAARRRGDVVVEVSIPDEEDFFCTDKVASERVKALIEEARARVNTDA